MAKLKFEIDTNDIFQGEYDDIRFEDLVKDAFKAEIVKTVTEKVSIQPIKVLSEKITHNVECAVEKKLFNLINEEIAMTDRWGKPEFVGTVEDYIKKQIDEKLMAPVNTNGKKLTGSCTSDETTWIEWAVKDEIRRQLKTITDTAAKTANQYCKEALDIELKKFTSETLSNEIAKRLAAVGVK